MQLQHPSRMLALKVMNTCLEAANPMKAMKSLVKVERNQHANGLSLVIKNKTIIPNLEDFDKTIVLGAGKASCEMASALLETKFPIDYGLIITKNGHGKPEDKARCEKAKIQVREASHPIPCENGRKATLDIISMLRKVDSPKTLIIWLASGGGSALSGGVGVKDHIDLASLKESMQWLLDSGADITQGKISQDCNHKMLLTMTNLSKPS
jgi:glycerate-2-kinase